MDVTSKRLWGLIALLFLVLAASAGAEPRVVTLPKDSPQVAVAPETGALAALDQSAKSVVLYPKLVNNGSLEGAITQTLGEKPDAVIHKQVKENGYFLVLCQAANTVYVLNDQTAAVVKRISLAAQSTPRTIVAPLNANAPYAFIALTQGVLRVDLDKMVDEGPIQFPDSSQYTWEIAVSPDGKQMYGRRVNVSPMGFACYRILPPKNPGDPVRAVQTYYQHDTYPPYVVDPTGQMVASGTILYTPDLTSRVGTLANTPVLFSATHPVFFCLDSGSITACSYNTLKPAGAVKLPRAMNPDEDQTPQVQKAAYIKHAQRTVAELPQVSDFGFCVAEKASKLIVHRDDDICIIPFTDFKLPNEPFLFADADVPSELKIGQESKISLHLRDPNVKLSLVDPPPQITLDGSTIKYTPKSDHIGTQKIWLKLSGGNLDKTQAIEVNVTRPSMVLPFSPFAMSFSPDAKSLLLLTHRRPEKPARPGAFRGAPEDQTPYAQLAIVDLPTMKVRAQRTLMVNLRMDNVGPAMDDKNIYLALRDSDAMLVLSAGDLSDVKRIFTEGHIGRITTAGGKLFAEQESNQSRMLIFNLPSLERAEGSTSREYQMRGFGEFPTFHQAGWEFRGILHDAKTNEPLLLSNLFGVATLPVQNRNQRFDNGAPMRGVRDAWGVRLDGGTLRRESGQTVTQLTGMEQTLLTDYPGMASLFINNTNTQQGARINVDVQIRDLVLGEVRQDLLLINEPVSMLQQQADRAQNMIAAPGIIAVNYFDRLFVLNTDELKSANLPMPLHFVAKQSAMVIDPDKPTTLTYQVVGGKGKITYALQAEMPGLTIDPSSGVVTITPADLISKSAEVLKQAMNNSQVPSNQQSGRALTRPEWYQQFAGDLFRQATGREATGAPVAIPINLIARDEEQQSAVLDHLVFMEVSPDVVQAPPEPRQKTNRAAANAVVDSPDIQALRRRVTQLEDENQRLKAQLELMKELVGPRAGTQPAAK